MFTLKDYLTNRRKSDFAKQLGISDSYLSQYLSGHRRPGYERMLEIERITNGQVSVQSWAGIAGNVDALPPRQEVTARKAKAGKRAGVA